MRFQIDRKFFLMSFVIVTIFYNPLNVLGISQEDTASNPQNSQAKSEDPPVDSKDKNTPTLIVKSPLKRISGYPLVEQRVADYRKIANSSKLKLEEGKPYVVEGVSVVGIFTANYGYGAFLKTEDGNTIIVKEGAKMYNGQVVSIKLDRVFFRQTNKKKLIEKLYGQNINARENRDETPQ